MVFHPPSWVPDLPFDPPDSIPISDFMLSEAYGRRAIGASRPPFTCGITGLEYSAYEVRERVDKLARGLSTELGWMPNEGSEWGKVVGVFTINTIDTFTLFWAVHRLSGICSPASAAYSPSELAYQLKHSGAKCLFTCLPLLSVAQEAAAKIGIPVNRVYLIPVPEGLCAGKKAPEGIRTMDQLIRDGAQTADLEPLRWSKGQGARQCAFLCYSSGTSGLPKGVKISHRNIIANVLQVASFEKPGRDIQGVALPNPSDYTEVILGLLPQSHIYACVLVCHLSVYRGDNIINLPSFSLKPFLETIQRFKINTLYLVPPIMITMIKNESLLQKYDLSSISSVFFGAAPMGEEPISTLSSQHPTWTLRQGYGMTETAVLTLNTSSQDVYFGSCGSLLPSVTAKLVSPTTGEEITTHDTPGELILKAPSVTLGYLNNASATSETFLPDGWLRTGDVALVRKSPKNGHEHFFIVDRIKELIKVKGHQVAPAELESHLLSHPAVADCAVVSIPDEEAGERPKAFIVKKGGGAVEENERLLVRDIKRFVEREKARYKWLREVEFVDKVPKTASGKIMRRVLKEREREKRRKEGGKL